MSWRLPFIILACLSVLFSAASFIWLVPSPRWLTLRGRQTEASAAWDKLGVGHAEREKAEIQQSTELRDATSESTETLARPGIPAAAPSSEHLSSRRSHGFFDIFSRDVRTRTGLAVFMMGMQQLSGIDGVLYVSLPIIPLALSHQFIPLHQTQPTDPNPVRPPPLRTSRPRLRRSLLPSVRHLGYRNLPRDRTRALPSRQMGPPPQHDLRRPRPRSNHVPNRLSLRRERRPPQLRCGPLGGNREHLPVRRHILRLLGGRH